MLSEPRYGGKLPTLESAFEHEGNLLLRLQQQHIAQGLRHVLWGDRASIVSLVRHHLGLATDDACVVLPPSSWIQGAFNICIFVEVIKQGASAKRYIFRCPMPHKLSEEQHPGTVDEKVCCEAASYVWIQEHCTDIRIPRLYGFGLTNGCHFTHVDKMSLRHRVYRSLCRWIHRFFGLPLLSNYVHNTSAPAVMTAYSILEYIGPETGQMLSDSWAECRNDVARRGRLYRGMARIMLSLARIPQRSIGAYRFNTSDSTVTLTNRPLTCSAIIMENSGAPRTIQPRQTYQSVESFTSDMLTLHDNYLLHQPHAVQDEDDAYERFTIRLLLRAVSHHFILPRWRDGPYVLQLTDFHQSNIFVDSEWNVVGMIDLEWICSLPIEMLSVPYWLTGCSIDGIIDKEYEDFDEARQDFLAAMDEEAETTSLKPKHDIPITHFMREMWLSKGVWFWACVRSLNGWLFVFEDHIVPKFSNDKKFITRLKGVAALWQEDVESVVKAKVEDEETYKRELRTCYEGIAQE
ncbi:hypothetical protein DL546_001171 [Coniochaeta pulveracea]|uniref:Uncharacterized protein n=1 Tax=Coniochaeta pulveracea TaxID=177199 RepID=A0A420Y0S0_9PEZI|nr:hypothetical protein DL546_001171 [Coniochaeta pulveracea]